MRSVVDGVIVTVCSAVVPWAVSWTVYVPGLVQTCEGAALVAEPPSPKLQSHELEATGEVSRRTIGWPATGLGGSISNVTVGAAPAFASQTAANASAKTGIEAKILRFMRRWSKEPGATSRPPPVEHPL